MKLVERLTRWPQRPPFSGRPSVADAAAKSNRSNPTEDTRDGLDLAFYAERYRDVERLSAEELKQHFQLHGRREGRFKNLADNIAHLEKSFGTLPPDFDPLKYRDAHDDLRKLELPAWEAAEHYLRYGRSERRSHFRFDANIYRELYFINQIVSDADLLADYQARGHAAGRFCSGAQLIRARGLEGGGRWVEALKPDEFTLLNYSWAGAAPTRLAALDLMISQGFARLAPLSFDLAFDPAFYRETHPALAKSNDEDCYRYWLFTGFERGDAGSPQQFFKALSLEIEAYPEAFNWKRFRGKSSNQETRWSALRRFLETGLTEENWPIEGNGAARFLMAIGLRLRGTDDRLAIRAFEMAKERGAFDGHVVQDLADCHFRLGEWKAALKYYGLRIGDPGADVWTFCNGARSALKSDEIDFAFEFLWQGKEKVVGSPHWRKVVEEAIESEFAAASERAHSHIKMGLRSRADQILESAVATIVQRFAKFDPLGVSIPAEPNGRIVALANVDLRQCTHYRVEQKQKLFKFLRRDFQVFAASEVEDFMAALPGASAAIFYRLPAFPRNVRAIEVARALGIPTYYDIDDLIFDSQEYPEPLSTYGNEIDREFYQELQFGVPLFRAAMSLCDYGISSTKSLAAHMKTVVRKGEVFILPNGIDDRNAGFIEAPPARVRRDDSIVIFYGSGTKAHNSDFFDLAAPALAELMHRNPKVKLIVVGYLSFDESFDTLMDRIVRIGWIPDINSYWSLLAEADIAIAVLARYPTTDAKSEIKWLEAGVMGIPSIVSGTAQYREVLEDGVDCLIADSPQEWASALDRLVTDAGLRHRLGEKAREKAQRSYSIEANARRLESFLPKPPLIAPALPSVKRRIILVNIFFPPQTLGGSTRVIRDNLDCFLDSEAASRFEFAIVTTDLGGEGRNLVRVEDYRGCPVFRVSTPSRSPMEWWPSHPHLGEWFSSVLQMWRPDLVHFHCVQRLSGALVEACAAAKIPYINSIHDAWWVSDWQFLTDTKDRLREPGEAMPFDPPSPVSIGDALDRRRYLTPLLKGSAAILAVSKAFAEIYRSCGFERTIALPNGTPPLQPAPRIPSHSGRVRLAHVGSITKFKGYHLVQAVLKQSRFSNVELTVVDHSRYGGEEWLTMWGATKVRIVGKTVQERMHEFYASQDVLLAPSLWPEPFGLVTREAIAAGLWVVASDRGAIGEDVTPDLNGWIIDVATPTPLLEVIGEIDANPKRFLQSPPSVPLRTAKDQAKDLITIYDEILDRPDGVLDPSRYVSQVRTASST